MKKFLLIPIIIFLLSGCSGSRDEIASADQSAKRLLPKIPKTTGIKTDKSASSEAKKVTVPSYESDAEVKTLIDRINKDIELTNITTADIDKGWYYASEEEKKWGTPRSWVWIDEGAGSYWISPDALEKLKDIETDELCRQTGGYYVISCIEREIPHCEHIDKSECRCSGSSAWVADQGCIMTGDDGKFADITSEELLQGWYYSLSNEKKLNTPPSWVWMENGKRSRWQNPSPKR